MRSRLDAWADAGLTSLSILRAARHQHRAADLRFKRSRRSPRLIPQILLNLFLGRIAVEQTPRLRHKHARANHRLPSRADRRPEAQASKASPVRLAVWEDVWVRIQKVAIFSVFSRVLAKTDGRHHPSVPPTVPRAKSRCETRFISDGYRNS
jgi:hypothetical protein